MRVIFEGSKEVCFDLEREIRPIEYMGLNEAKGGCGGYTKYTQERNGKISAKLKGVPKSLEHRRNLSIARIGKFGKEKNPRATHWLLISPNGIECLIHGNLQATCEILKISCATLRNNLGSTVGNVSVKYTCQDPELCAIRQNTVGWTLSKGV